MEIDNVTLLDEFLNVSNSTAPHRPTVKISKIIIAAIYSSLSLGFLFNCSVAATIVNVFKNSRKTRSTVKHTFMYILTLSCVDALVLANLPLIVGDMLMNGWVFGTVLCKLHLIADSVNKILSSFILTALSFDRYLIVCFPHRFRFWRRMRVTIGVLAVCILMAMLLLFPRYTNTEVVSNDVYFKGKNVTVVKCFYRYEQTGKDYWIYSVFALGYCLPLMLMTFFYTSIIYQIYRSSCRTGQANRRTYTRTVTKNTSILVIFYFFCWTPYWISMIYIDAADNKEQKPNFSISVLMYFIHILVYVNSAVNPLLYALLNRELRRQCFIARQKKRNSSNVLELNYTNGNSVCYQTCSPRV